MSTVLYADGDVYITTYCGPQRSDDMSRKRVQISVIATTPDTDRTIINMDMGQWLHLHQAALQLGPECEGREV